MKNEDKSPASVVAEGHKLSFKETYPTSMGMVIGSVIITSTGICMGFTGTGVWISYILAGLLCFFINLPTMMCASAIPRTSGNYFMAMQVSPIVGGFSAYLFLWSPISLGFMGVSFASYMQSIVNFGSTQLWAAFILTVFFLLNLCDLKGIIKIEVILDILLIVGWGSFLILGLPKVDWSVFTLANMFPKGAAGQWEAIATVCFAMGGGLWMIEGAGKLKNPDKHVVLGNMASTGSAILLFALIAIVGSGILPLEEVVNKPLTLVAKTIYPGKLYILFVLGSAIGALLTTINVRFMQSGMTILRSTKEGWFPEKVCKLNKHGVPVYFLIYVWLVAMLPVVFNINTTVLAKMAAASSNVTTLIPLISVPFVIKKFPEEWKKSRWYIPYGALVALVCVAAAVMLALIVRNFMSFPPMIILLSVVMLLAFWFVAKWRAPAAAKIADQRKHVIE